MAKRAKPNTVGGDDAGTPAEPPITAPGAAVQEQPGGGVDGDAGVPVGEIPGAASSLPPDGAALSDDIPQSDGAAQNADATDLATAVAMIAAGGTGNAPIMPPGSTIEFQPSGFAVKVTGPKRGRRRIGRAFGADPVLIPLGELSQDEVTELNADHALTVEVVPAP